MFCYIFTDNSSQAQLAPDTSENRVHTTVSQSPQTTQINNNKPPVNPPPPNISSIVSADFGKLNILIPY